MGAKAEADATIDRMEMALENFMVYIHWEIVRKKIICPLPTSVNLWWRLGNHLVSDKRYSTWNVIIYS